MDRSDLSEISLVRYLWYLFQNRDLAASTLGVHRAAVSSLSNPLDNSLSNSFLLQRFMRAVFLTRPPARRRPREAWDVATLLDFLRTWGPLESLSFRQLSH
jgi:hypothetical protein